MRRAPHPWSANNLIHIEELTIGIGDLK